jgi:hypothetical protein
MQRRRDSSPHGVQKERKEIQEGVTACCSPQGHAPVAYFLLLGPPSYFSPSCIIDPSGENPFIRPGPSWSNHPWKQTVTEYALLIQAFLNPVKVTMKINHHTESNQKLI